MHRESPQRGKRSKKKEKEPVFEGLTRNLDKNWEFGTSKTVWTRIAKLGRFGISVLPGSWSCFIWLNYHLSHWRCHQLIWRTQLRARLVLGCWRADIQVQVDSTGKLLYLDIFFAEIEVTVQFCNRKCCSDQVWTVSLSLTVSLLSSKLLTRSWVLSTEFWTWDFCFDEKWWKWIRPFRRLGLCIVSLRRDGLPQSTIRRWYRPIGFYSRVQSTSRRSRHVHQVLPTTFD